MAIDNDNECFFRFECLTRINLLFKYLNPVSLNGVQQGFAQMSILIQAKDKKSQLLGREL